MKRQTGNLVILILTLLFFSCYQKPKTELFYLNSTYEKTKELVKFLCKENNDYQLWEVSRNETNTLIKTKRLNSKKKLIDETLEKITENGSELISYTFVNNSGEFPFEIEFYPKRKDLIKWDLNEKSIYSGEFIYNGIIFNFKRVRIFLKKQKDILIFQDNFEIKPINGQLNKQMNQFYNQNFIQTTYFKKNKGLVKYERLYKNGEKKIFEIES